jgi:hypothetical protein
VPFHLTAGEKSMQGFAQLVLALLGLAIVAFVLYFVGGMFYDAREEISGCLMLLLLVGGGITVLVSLISLGRICHEIQALALGIRV